MLLLVSVELDGNGKPDLQLPASATVDKLDGGIFAVYWSDNILMLDRLGVLGGKLRFLASGGRGVEAKLTHLGASVARVRDLYPTLTASQREWLSDRKVRLVRVNGTPVGYYPRNVICGHDPAAVALDGLDLADDDVVTVDA